MNRILTSLLLCLPLAVAAEPATPGPWRLHEADARDERVRALRDAAQARQRAAVRHAKRQGWKTRSIDAQGRVFELMALDGDRPLVNSTENKDAAVSSSADQVRDTSPYLVNGSTVTAGVWDGGAARATHVEFGGRVTVEDGSSPIDHASHVAGTIGAGGTNTSAEGMAPRVQIASYDWGSDVSEMTSRAMSVPGEPGTIQVSNHSYSFLSGWSYSFSPPRWYGTWGIGREADSFGQYNTFTREWDELCYNAPYYLPFKSAGNDRNDNAPSHGTTIQYFNPNLSSKSYDSATDPIGDGASGGYDCIPVRGCAKNVMTIGAVHDAVTFGLRDVGSANMSSFSSWGPTDDGRIKPDVVANGTGLLSAGGGGDTQYLSFSGTSMSSPNAAGSAVLLTEVFTQILPGQYMRASTLKGLIIHTADDLGTAGPDYAFGWGLMHTRRAADLIAYHGALPEARALVETSIASNETEQTHAILWDGASPLRVTLCWTDPPGPALSGLDNRTPVLVHDLDLRLVTPDGTTNFPYVLNGTNPVAAATTGDNDIDNVEQVYLATPTVTGTYTVVVAVESNLTAAAQAYSLCISGSTAAPRIQHTPALNTTNQVGFVPVDVNLSPAFVIDPGAIAIHWNTDGQTNAFTSTPLSLVSGTLYRAWVPAQPLGTSVYYYVSAQSTLGNATTDPTNAPAELHSYTTVVPVTLQVTGTPGSFETVAPDYGTNVYPMGVPLSIAAPSHTVATNGTRHALTGWTGTGSVPANGSSNRVAITIATHSTIQWNWALQYALVQSGTVAGAAQTTDWWFAGATGTTATAQESILSGGTTYQFTAWSWNGARLPDPSNAAANPATGILMDTAQVAVASYMDATLDGDGDALADWWEYRFYGSTNGDATADLDADGFSDLLEFGDRSNPRDGTSVPSSPVIVHVPLADPQAAPAPFTVSATITDNFEIASAVLKWRRGALPYQSINMSTGAVPGSYAGTIPAPGTNGTSFEYIVTASDGAGFEAFDGVHAFAVAYPLATVSTQGPIAVLLRPNGQTNFSMQLGNTGNAALFWQTDLRSTGLQDDFESGAAAWTHGGAQDKWHLSGLHTRSPSNAWYCGDAGTGLYDSSMDAHVDTPPIRLGPDAELRFWHWPQFEILSSTVTWDGGLLEISTNGGVSFASLTPLGGYPYTTEPHDASPFIPNVAVPCFAGTGTWREDVVDLSAYAGQDVVIRFRVGSDAFVVDVGWFIDDVRILPGSGTNDWFSVQPGTGTIAAAGSTNVTLSFNATNIPTGDFSATLDLGSNDPLTPTNRIPVVLHVRSPATLAVAAEQLPHDGSGIVTISNLIVDADSEAHTLAIDVSLDAGATWTNAWLQSALASEGVPILSNAEPRQVHAVTTTSAGFTPGSNWVTVAWPSATQTPTVVVDSNVWVRLRSWDPWFAGAGATSTPFLVDNEAPTAIAAVTGVTHTVGIWSSNPALTVAWTPATDGMGSGIAGYAHIFDPTGVAPHPGSTTTVVGASAGTVHMGEASNFWVGVRAVDVFGNTGSATYAGPFRIDTLPPGASNATISPVLSPYGDYIVGTNATIQWSGFTERGSGVAEYFYGTADGGGTTNGTAAATTNGTLSGLAAPATNAVFVWARDLLGQIGLAATGAVVTLAGDADDDGDGLDNAGEEIAGTDALDQADFFYAETDAGSIAGETIVRWPWATNREYVVYCHVDPTNIASGIIISNPVYSVTNAMAQWLHSTNATAASLFYRVEMFVTP